jgi:MoaA/NifB/PqqE/SkfB family radical SAM enzyme
MSNDRKKIIAQLLDKEVLIWGARMTGLGALRKLKAAGIKVIGFIDSDIAFIGKKVSNLPVYQPLNVNKILGATKNVAILIAVALKEDEILSQIKTVQDINTPIFSFHDENSPYYTIDILSSCNLRCSSCPHSISDHDVPKGSMTLETLKKVVDKIVTDTPTISHISLYSWGEPLIHPYLNEIVKYIHERDIAVALSSNLSINFDKRLDNLIELSPDYLKISVSGFYPTAYDNTHEGGDINLVKSNLYKIRHLIDKYNSSTLIDINYHLYRDNSGVNLEKFEELATELNFVLSKTYALVMPLERVISFIDGNPDEQTTKLQENLLVRIEEGIEASSQTRLPKNQCPFRENQININADLSVPVCCTVFQRDKNVVAKNFLESSLYEINKQKSEVSICGKCMNLSLPEYNMGFNRPGWDKYAKEKSLLDAGLTVKS